MSLATSTFQALRSCTASLSARSLARPAVVRCPIRMSRLWVRCYSEVTSTPDPEQTKAEEQPDKVSEIEGKLKAKENEVVDLTGRLRYLQADFLNLQRNAAREKEQTRDFAITRFASDLLETVDVLSIALKSVPQSALTSSSTPASTDPSDADIPSPLPPSDTPSSDTPPFKTPEAYLQELHKGVEMTQRLLLQTLFKYHVKPFDPTGDRFDPNLHEALYQVPFPDKEPGTVIDCQKVGYKIKDRVLRAAQVGVAQDISP